MSEAEVYRLLFASEKETPRGELPPQQIEDIRTGELLPDTLTLADVESALNHFHLEHTQLKKEGDSYTISMENAESLKDLLANNQTLPDKLKDKKLAMLAAKTADIKSAIVKMQPIKIGDIKQIEGHSTKLENVSADHAKDLACLIDYEAKRIIAILENTATPEMPKLYTELIQRRETSNQEKKEQETKLTKLNEAYKDQTSVLKELEQQTNRELLELVKNIGTLIACYRKNEKAFFKLQYKNPSSDPMWDQLVTLNDFLRVETIDKLFLMRNGEMGFPAYKKVKTNLDQLSELKATYLHYHTQYQIWKQVSIKEVKDYLNSPNLLVRLYRFLFGNSQSMIEQIEIKATQIDEAFQTILTQINEDFLGSTQASIESINFTEKYHSAFINILPNKGIDCDPVSNELKVDELESIAIEDEAAPLLAKCEAVQAALLPLPKQPQLDLPLDFSSPPVKYHSIAAQHITQLYNLIEERNSKLYLVNVCFARINEYRGRLPELKDDSEYNKCIKRIESKIAEAQQTMVELEPINTQLITLMRTFMLDPQTKSIYESLAQQCQTLEKNVSEIQKYCVDAETSLSGGMQQIEAFASENEEKLIQLIQEKDMLFKKFPLSQYEEKLSHVAENFSAEKFGIWLNIQKMYQDAKTQVERQTSAYVIYVNSHLTDDKVTWLTRLWRALFGDHTKNGIKRAEANVAKMRSEMDKLYASFDKEFSKAKEPDQELLQKEANQLLQLLLKNSEQVHKDGSGLNPHSYTRCLQAAHQTFQRNQNNFKFWAEENPVVNDIQKKIRTNTKQSFNNHNSLK